MDAVARRDAEIEMGLVLENRRRRRQDDVGEQDVFGVQPHRAVHGGDHRRLDIEKVHQDFSALAIDLVVALRAEEVEAVRTDFLHEGVAAAGQDHNAIVGIGADGVKQVDELLVSMAVKNQRPAIRVQRRLQHAARERVRRALGKLSR